MFFGLNIINIDLLVGMGTCKHLEIITFSLLMMLQIWLVDNKSHLIL